MSAKRPEPPPENPGRYDADRPTSPPPPPKKSGDPYINSLRDEIADLKRQLAEADRAIEDLHRGYGEEYDRVLKKWEQSLIELAAAREREERLTKEVDRRGVVVEAAYLWLDGHYGFGRDAIDARRADGALKRAIEFTHRRRSGKGVDDSVEEEDRMSDSLELRKAVAAAVGWEWYDYRAGGGSAFAVESTPARTVRFDSGLWCEDQDENIRVMSFDDAIAACEAAGMIGENARVVIGGGRCQIQSIHRNSPFHDWVIKSRSDGATPTSLCRALLKALEAKHGD